MSKIHADGTRPCRGCGNPILAPNGGRGEWDRYCAPSCRPAPNKITWRALRPGEPLPAFPARRYRTVQGYIQLRWTVATNQIDWVYEHRVKDGRVVADEHVHHRNRVRDDNRADNLEGMTAQAHVEEHTEVRPHEVAVLYLSGLTQPQIARRLGCDTSVVCRALGKAGVPARTARERAPWPPEADLRRAYAACTSATAMAALLGIPVGRVRDAMRYYEMPSFGPGRPKAA